MSTDPQDAAPALPDGWRLIPPESLGTPGIAFAAAHEVPDAGFTANVTVGVQRSADPGLVRALGAEAVEVGDARWERGGTGWQDGAPDPLPAGTVAITLAAP